MKDLSARKWAICAVLTLGILLVGMALVTYIVDPYFHYHKPYNGIKYRLYEQRYINDGISRHFEYDAVITGNSLSENMKTSKFDELFQTNSIKLPYSGAGFKELWGSLDKTLSYNEDVKQVLVVVDFDDICKQADYTRYTEYPEYLYDDNVFNDASYLWNKNTFYRGTTYNLLMTITGEESTTFDEYSQRDEQAGVETVMPHVGYICKPEEITPKEYTEQTEKMVTDNIEENILSVIHKYPEIEFHLLLTPSSIARWCVYNNYGEIDYRIKGCKNASELLLTMENVHLYSFYNDYEMICNLDNYYDTIHYTDEVAEYLLENVAVGDHRLTFENYEEHFKEISDFYINYDYRSLAITESNFYR